MTGVRTLFATAYGRKSINDPKMFLIHEGHLHSGYCYARSRALSSKKVSNIQQITSSAGIPSLDSPRRRHSHNVSNPSHLSILRVLPNSIQDDSMDTKKHIPCNHPYPCVAIGIKAVNAFPCNLPSRSCADKQTKPLYYPSN